MKRIEDLTALTEAVRRVEEASIFPSIKRGSGNKEVKTDPKKKKININSWWNEFEQTIRKLKDDDTKEYSIVFPEDVAGDYEILPNWDISYDEGKLFSKKRDLFFTKYNVSLQLKNTDKDIKMLYQKMDYLKVN